MIAEVAAGAGAVSPAVLGAVVGVVVALGGGTGLAAILRSRPERTRILIDASNDVVVMQKGAITDLRAEIADLRARVESLYLFQSRVRELEHDNEVLLADNTRLRARVSSLES